MPGNGEHEPTGNHPSTITGESGTVYQNVVVPDANLGQADHLVSDAEQAPAPEAQSQGQG